MLTDSRGLGEATTSLTQRARERRKKRADCQHRPLEAKETRHWVNAIDQAGVAVTSAGSKPWFQVDREGDRYWTLKALRDTGGWFTVRSTYAHRFVFSGPTRRRRRLRDVARKAALRGTIKLNLRDRPNRKARVALLQMRTAAVVLDTVEAFTEERMELPVNIVEVRRDWHHASGRGAAALAAADQPPRRDRSRHRCNS